MENIKERLKVIRHNATLMEAFAGMMAIALGPEFQKIKNVAAQLNECADMIEAQEIIIESLRETVETLQSKRSSNNGCQLPPPGWWCSREPGHDGPCAAYSNSGY